jgi:hypothetical protein
MFVGQYGIYSDRVSERWTLELKAICFVVGDPDKLYGKERYVNRGKTINRGECWNVQKISLQPPRMSWYTCTHMLDQWRVYLFERP